MARRRRVAAPSEADISRLEAEYGQGDDTAAAATAAAAIPRPAPLGGLSPIAQVAAEAAAEARPEPPERRAAQARDTADAARYRSAEAAGRVMVDLPLEVIDADAMVRDRMVLDQSELDELRRSILDHGLRLPIEVYAREDGSYGLISGYRRLRAVRSIHGELGLPGHDTIRAVVRDPQELGGAVVAMVEENEIRAQLSHYERGRIAVIAAQDGGFLNVEAAVSALFASASKGKRSKIRSFALIHEELGDLLEHGDRLTERDGLRLAGMLRQGGEARLRAALEDGPAETPEAEWAMIEPVLRAHEKGLAQGGAGEAGAPRAGPGRPRRARGDGPSDVETLSSGVRLERRKVEGGFAVTITGRGIDGAIMDEVMNRLRYLLERP